MWLGNLAGVGVDRGPVVSRGSAYVVDLALIAVFGLQHSVMARPWWKARFGQLAPERPLYLLATSTAIGLLIWFWRPLPVSIWDFPQAVTIGQIAGLALIGWAVAALDARAFFGLRPAPPGLRLTGPYRWMRHPIFLGTILVLWVVPKMTEGHLLFSAAMTVYGIIGTVFETRDLKALAGTRQDLLH